MGEKGRKDGTQEGQNAGRKVGRQVGKQARRFGKSVGYGLSGCVLPTSNHILKILIFHVAVIVGGSLGDD